jgi:hypothetical protein
MCRNSTIWAHGSVQVFSAAMHRIRSDRQYCRSGNAIFCVFYYGSGSSLFLSSKQWKYLLDRYRYPIWRTFSNYLNRFSRCRIQNQESRSRKGYDIRIRIGKLWIRKTVELLGRADQDADPRLKRSKFNININYPMLGCVSFLTMVPSC